MSKSAFYFVTTPFVDDYRLAHDASSFCTFDTFAAHMHEQAKRWSIIDVLRSARYFMQELSSVNFEFCDFLPCAIGMWGKQKYILIRGEVVPYEWSSCLDVT